MECVCDGTAAVVGRGAVVPGGQSSVARVSLGGSPELRRAEVSCPALSWHSMKALREAYEHPHAAPAGHDGLEAYLIPSALRSFLRKCMRLFSSRITKKPGTFALHSALQRNATAVPAQCHADELSLLPRTYQSTDKTQSGAMQAYKNAEPWRE